MLAGRSDDGVASVRVSDGSGGVGGGVGVDVDVDRPTAGLLRYCYSNISFFSLV